MSGPEQIAAPRAVAAGSPPFRFYDNRQKYLTFVNTCNEKAVVVKRATMELARVHPRPPALRFFDAGMGDATVLSRLMRTTHQLFPTVPLLAVAKEISLEDVRLGLEKMSDRFYEHGNTVLVITNLSYANAPSLALPEARASVNWQMIRLEGSSSNEFARPDRGAWSRRWRTPGRPRRTRRPATRRTCARRCSSSTARTTSSCSTR